MSYGAGLALIVDEFALLLDLKDVYWAKQGRISVDLGVGASSLAGTYFAALPLIRALRRGHGEEGNAGMTTRIDQFSSPAAAGSGSGTDEVNVWIVGDDEEVIVIDPGTDAAAACSTGGRAGDPRRHLHPRPRRPRHRGRLEVAGRDEAPVALHRADLMLARGAPERRPGHRDGGRRHLRGRRRPAGGAARARPQPGSVCLYSEELAAVFTGDAVTDAARSR